MFEVTVEELIDDALPCRFVDKTETAPAEKAPEAELTEKEEPAESAKAAEEVKPEEKAEEKPEEKPEEKKEKKGGFFSALFGRRK